MDNARMDENKPRRRWLSFGIRDLLWAMVVVGLLIGWWRSNHSLKWQLENVIEAAESQGNEVTVGDNWVEVRGSSGNSSRFIKGHAK